MKNKLFKLASLATNSVKVASIVCLTLASTMVNAQTLITVENSDFSLPGTGKQTNWGSVPGWASDAQPVVNSDSGVELSNGSDAGYLKSTETSVYNLTEHVIALGEQYQLSMDFWDAYNSDQFTVTLYYDDGNGGRVVLGTKSATPQYLPAPPAPQIPGIITLTAAATADAVGKKLGIEIDNTGVGGGDAWTRFDDVELSYTTTLGVNDFELGENSFKIFPNPTNGGAFQISHNSAESSINVKIYNILSEKILNQNFDASSKTLEINPHLTPGIYIVKVNDKFSSKLIVK